MYDNVWMLGSLKFINLTAERDFANLALGPLGLGTSHKVIAKMPSWTLFFETPTSGKPPRRSESWGPWGSEVILDLSIDMSDICHTNWYINVQFIIHIYTYWLFFIIRLHNQFFHNYICLIQDIHLLECTVALHRTLLIATNSTNDVCAGRFWADPECWWCHFLLAWHDSPLGNEFSTKTTGFTETGDPHSFSNSRGEKSMAISGT